MSGTSMATPHVSGVAALVKSVNPGLTNVQIKNIILNNVDVKSSLSGKVSTSGRLNAYKAVMAAQPTAGADEIGVFRNGGWWLDYNGNGVWNSGTDLYYNWGTTGDVPLVGDWNGDGKTEVGVFRKGGWWLDYNGKGVWNSGTDLYYTWGGTGDKPVLGKW